MRRREFLAQAGALTLAPAAAGTAAPATGAGFRHGVASFDPTTHGVLLWTRGPADAALRWVVARDRGLREVVARGAAGPTTAAADHTVTVAVDDLEPATTYWYRFEAEGTRSPVGRTRTLPDQQRLRVGVVSCARFATDRFGAYRSLARREVDVVLHLGDYIYADAGGDDDLRTHDPPRTCTTLSDYRARYAQTRADPDLRALHARHPMAVVWDDNEIAGNAWRGGAAGHDSATHGAWAARVAAAVQAHHEWVPVALPDPRQPGRIWRALDAGSFARIVLLDTRLAGRDRPVEQANVSDAHDDERTLLGVEQRAWLLDHLADPEPAWLLVGNQVMLNALRIPAGTVDDPSALGLVVDGDAAISPDQWDGYTAERTRLVDAVRDEGGVVVVTGDLHSSWAFAGPGSGAGEAAMVEAVVPSVNSRTLGDRLPGSAGLFQAGARVLDPTLELVDLLEHGYVIVDLTPARAQIEWWFVDPSDPRGRARLGGAFTVDSGRPARLTPAPHPTRDALATTIAGGAVGVDVDDDPGVPGLVALGGGALVGVAAAVALRRRRSGAPHQP
jgi:alkaline phosphatase D